MAAHDTVDAYLADQPAPQRAALEDVRRRVRALVPDAVEVISYGIPTFKLDGRPVVYFAGWKAHCSLYPVPDRFLAQHTDELRGYKRTKGSLHFPPDAPLSDELLRVFVETRLEDIHAGRR